MKFRIPFPISRNLLAGALSKKDILYFLLTAEKFITIKEGVFICRYRIMD